MPHAHRRFLPAAVAVLSAAALSGCALTPTPYQPYVAEGAAGVHGGYSEQRIAPDRYVVRFHGNDMTSRDRVEGYMLYRAAQLTIESGYDWFVPIDRNTEHDVRTYVEPDPFYHPWYGPGYGYWRPHWGFYTRGYGWNYWDPWGGSPFWYDQTRIRTVEAFEATAEIQMRKGPVPASDPRAIDARKVIAQLGPTIELPKPR